MSHNAEILRGIPRGPWVDKWATEQEEAGENFSGQNLDPLAPPTPVWAKKWGRKVADEIVKANKVVRGRRDVTLDFLYQMVKEAGYPHDREHFGYHLGMQAAGHGVSWSDDCKLPHDAIEVPYHEFY